MKRDQPTHTYRISEPLGVIKEIDKYLARYPQFVCTGMNIVGYEDDVIIYQVRYFRCPS